MVLFMMVLIIGAVHDGAVHGADSNYDGVVHDFLFTAYIFREDKLFL